MGGRGTALRLTVAALVALRWSLHFFWLAPTPDACRPPPRAEGWYAPQPSACPNRWPLTQRAPADLLPLGLRHGGTGPVGVLAAALSCKLGGTQGVVAAGLALHILNTYLALGLAATLLAG